MEKSENKLKEQQLRAEIRIMLSKYIDNSPSISLIENKIRDLELLVFNRAYKQVSQRFVYDFVGITSH